VLKYVALALSLVLSFPAYAETFKTVAVKDGDTIAVLTRDKKTITCRLDSIDAPEKGMDYGQAAKKYLSSLIFGKQVYIEPHTLDKYGRTVATVWLGDVNVNLQMVKAGFAWVYRKYARDRAYYDAEATAKANRLGLWSLPNPVEPWVFRHPTGLPLGLSAAVQDKCHLKRVCREMVSCEEAKYYLTVCGFHGLDKNGDGIPCSKLCR
jgi:endonuclease YncB( thermonuclease family)